MHQRAKRVQKKHHLKAIRNHKTTMLAKQLQRIVWQSDFQLNHHDV